MTGLQGNDPKYFKVISTPKHYAVHSGPEPLRHGFNVNVSPHDLEDTYLPAFRATVVEGHADSVMCAYNALDGVPACANKFLLQDTLRDTWKFQGYVTSDCGAVGDITTGHKFTPDDEHAAALSVLAGTDTTCGDEYVALVQAVHDGLIKESEIDTSLKRLFTARFRLGMFDPPNAVAFNQIPISENDSPAHRQLSLRAARESIVLLKNQNGILPLQANIQDTGGGWTQCGVLGGARRQLLRHAASSGFSLGRNAQGFCRKEDSFRPGISLRGAVAGPRAFQYLSFGRWHRPPGTRGRVLFPHRFFWKTGADAGGPDHSV